MRDCQKRLLSSVFRKLTSGSSGRKAGVPALGIVQVLSAGKGDTFASVSERGS